MTGIDHIVNTSKLTIFTISDIQILLLVTIDSYFNTLPTSNWFGQWQPNKHMGMFINRP